MDGNCVAYCATCPNRGPVLVLEVVWYMMLDRPKTDCWFLGGLRLQGLPLGMVVDAHPCAPARSKPPCRGPPILCEEVVLPRGEQVRDWEWEGHHVMCLVSVVFQVLN